MSIIIVRSNPPPTESLVFPREFARRMAELSRLALKRLEERKGEDVDEWANQLASSVADLSD